MKRRAQVAMGDPAKEIGTALVCVAALLIAVESSGTFFALGDKLGVRSGCAIRAYSLNPIVVEPADIRRYLTHDCIRWQLAISNNAYHARARSLIVAHRATFRARLE